MQFLTRPSLQLAAPRVAPITFSQAGIQKPLEGTDTTGGTNPFPTAPPAPPAAPAEPQPMPPFTDDEIDAIRQRILDRISEKIGGGQPLGPRRSIL